MFRSLIKSLGLLLGVVAVWLLALQAKMLVFARRLNWRKVGVIALELVPMVLMGGAAAFAAGGTPPAPSYIAPTGAGAAAATTISSSVEQLATIIRWILGATGLLALLVAAIMNHVPNQHTKEQAKEILMAAIVGLLIAAFAPQIIGFFVGLA